MAIKTIPQGMIFGRLVVVGIGKPQATKAGHNLSTSECLCECGNRTTVLNVNLKRGDSRSCGCLDIESRRTRCVTHGHSRSGKATSEHASWSSMLSRVTNPNNERWTRYGGRGITVCERWRTFEKFLDDMGPKPEPKSDYSIDRIDNDGNYCPENCRWATRSEQQNNRNCNRLFTFYGKTRGINEWSKITQIPHDTIRTRIKRNWPERLAFWAPTGSKLRQMKKQHPHHAQENAGPVR